MDLFIACRTALKLVLKEPVKIKNPTCTDKNKLTIKNKKCIMV